VGRHLGGERGELEARQWRMAGGIPLVFHEFFFRHAADVAGGTKFGPGYRVADVRKAKLALGLVRNQPPPFFLVGLRPICRRPVAGLAGNPEIQRLDGLGRFSVGMLGILGPGRVAAEAGLHRLHFFR